MNKEEAEALKGMIDSFVEESGGEMLISSPPKRREDILEPFLKPTEEEYQKMFRDEMPEKGWEGRFIRSSMTGDRVFLEVDGTERRWIPDLETLERLGGKLDEVLDISDEEMAKLKERFGLLSVKLWNE